MASAPPPPSWTFAFPGLASWANSTGALNVSFPEIPNPQNAFNTSALEYHVPPRTRDYAEMNAFRPVTLITIYDNAYWLGLFYIPFVLLGAFTLYIILISLFAMYRKQERLHTWVCVPAKVNECLLALLALLSMGGFAASIAFSILIYESTRVLASDFTTLSELLQRMSGDLSSLSSSASLLDTRVSNITCVIPGLAESIQDVASPMANNLVSSIATMQVDITQANTDFVLAADKADMIFSIQALVALILSLVMFVLTLMASLGLVCKLRRINTGRFSPRFSCCTGTCFCAALCIAIVIVLCSAAHVIALLLTDVCYPQVNDNINSIVGQVSSPVYNVARVNSCGSLDTSTAPTVLVALCYIQTCDARFDALVLARGNFESNVSTILTGFDALPKGVCRGDDEAIVSLWHVISDALLPVYHMSCSQVNPPYAKLAYETLCDTHVKWSIALFASWIGACAMLMLAHLHWMTMMGDAERKRTESQTSAGKPVMQQQQQEHPDVHMMRTNELDAQSVKSLVNC